MSIVRKFAPLAQNLTERSIVDPLSLHMTGIVKDFPGLRALDGVEFSLAAGEVHALLGINGAGKSTLIKILSGVYRKDAGEIRVHDVPVEITSPQAAMECGVATVYQDPQMVPSFTGCENIFLGAETEAGGLFSRIDRKGLRARAEALLERFPVEVDLDRPVGELGPVQRESIAVLRALSRENMSILVLDEPTSILTRSEIDVLFRQIRMLAERGISIIYITHRLDEVFEIAERFTVLRDGRNVATCRTDESDADHARIAELMLGKKLATVYPEKGGGAGEDVMSVESLGFAGAFEDVSFTAARGQVLGIFGLVGSGTDELCKVLFGILRGTTGSIVMHGRAVVHRSAGDAIDDGLFLIPGDRRAEGQIADEAVSFNMTLANLGRVSGVSGLINHRKEQADADQLVSQLAVKTPTVNETVSLLSGGNQQKVVIAKGLYADSEVYVFQEPTVGVDVGAKAGIYRLIRDLSRDKAVVVVGSDCEEVYGLCDRAMVMYKGRVVTDTPVADVRLEEMLLYGLTGRGLGEAAGQVDEPGR